MRTPDMLSKLMAGVLVLVSLPGVMAARQIEVQFERLELTTPEARSLVEKLQARDTAVAMKEARKLVKKHPGNLELWHILGSLQAEAGEYDEALASLASGVRGEKSDLPFLLLMARIHEDRAELGPGGSRVAGGVRYQPSALLAGDRASFSKEQLRLAAEKFALALKLHPETKTYQAKHVALLLAAGEAEAAATASAAYLQLNPGDGDLLLQQAKAAVNLGRWAEARAAAEQCLVSLPADPELHAVLSQIAAQAGRSEEASAWNRRARFHSFIPEFLPLPYSEAGFARIAPLLRSEAATDDEAQQKAWREQAKVAIEALIADKSDDATRMLAAVAWRHEWHGEVENAIYDELEARRAEAVLMALFDRANSVCTVGSCAPALARLGSEAAFPLMIERLPMDRNMFAMNLPEALVIYGRPEAVAPLAEALAAAVGEDDRRHGSIDAMLGGMGTGMFIRRCLRALDRFGTPPARAALEKYADHRVYGVEVNASLFLQTREKRHLDKLLKQLRKAPDDAADVAERFEKAGLPEAASIAALAKKSAKKK